MADASQNAGTMDDITVWLGAVAEVWRLVLEPIQLANSARLTRTAVAAAEVTSHAPDWERTGVGLGGGVSAARNRVVYVGYL
jgi:hypothetical protein